MLNVDKMLKRAIPGLKAIFDGSQGMLDDLYKLSTEMFDDMAVFYNTRKRHRQSRKPQIGRAIFVAANPALEPNKNADLPAHIYATMVDMFYSAYCDGYHRVNR